MSPAFPAIGRTLARCAAMVFFISGCANNSINLPALRESSSPQADPRLTQGDDAKFFSRSGLEACVGGALIGVLACELMPGGGKEKKEERKRDKDKNMCRLTAAVVGCGVGAGANYYLDVRRSEYANKEQRLNAMIDDVRKDNQRLRNLTTTAREVMADDRKEIAQLRTDIAKQKIARNDAEQKIADIDANAAYLKKTLAELKSREAEWRKVAASEKNSGSRTDALDAEISKMQKQIVALESEVDELYQQRSAIKLG